MSTLFGIAAGRRDGPQRQVEHRPADRIGLSTTSTSAFFGDGAFGQLLGGVDPQRRLVDPRVVDHVGQLAQLVETRTAQRGRHQGTKSGHDCSCWRTVTRVSAKEVTIGIDIGTTAVKAVAADEDGQVVARTRIPHQLRVPAPDRLEHDADAGVATRPVGGAGPSSAGPTPRAVAVTAMVPSLTAVDDVGRPLTPGLLYGDSRGRGSAGADTTLPHPARRSNSCAGRRERRPTPKGYWPATAVANYALAGEAVLDNASASTTYPLFDGTGWSEDRCARVRRDGRPHAQGRADRRRGRPTARCRRRAGRRFGRRALRAACRRCRPGRRRGRALRHDADRVDHHSRVPRGARPVDRCRTPAAGKFQIGGPSNAGGLFLGWVDRLVAEDNSTVEPGRVPVWSPYVRGERTPYHDPDRRAVLDGLDLTHGGASVRRAGYEASGFVVRQLIELSGAPAARIVATGGGHPRAAVDAGDRRCDRSARRGVGGAGGRGAGRGVPRPDGGGPRDVDRPTPPGGRRRSASSSPIPRGPTRCRTATPGSSS